MESITTQIEEILPRIGLNYRKIAEQQGVSPTTVMNILRNKQDKFYSEETKQAVWNQVFAEIDNTIQLLEGVKKYQC